MTDDILVVDALSAGTGQRRSSRDSIGCGPRSVAGVLETHGINCRITRVEALIQNPGKVRRFDHLAVSAMTMDLPIVKRVITLWRKNRSKGKVLLGGPIASAPASVLKDTKPDVLVIGEGEETLSTLIEQDFLRGKTNLSQIAGIGYIDKAGTHITANRPHISQKDLWNRFSPSTTRIVDYPITRSS